MSLTQFAMVEELAHLIKDNLSSKHLVLSVEDALVNFLQADPSPNGTVELQPMGPYHRLLLHRLADIFGFAHESIGEGEDRRLVLACCQETSIPSILVSDILYQQDLFQSQPTPYEILKREDGSSVLEIKSAPASITLEEREEAYLAARRRIFSTCDDDGSREAVRQKPRHVPVVAQRMIAHALGQRINPCSQARGDDCGKSGSTADLDESPEAISHRVNKLSCNESSTDDCEKALNTKSDEEGVGTKINGSHSIADMRRENLGAAKRMFAHALGKQQSSRKVVSPDAGK